MNYTGLSHVAFVTGDLDLTIRFWRDLLGLEMVLSLGREGYKLYFFHLTGQQYVGFFEWPGAEPVEEKEAGHPRGGPRVFDHFALGVASDEDLWKIKDRLEAAGEWVSEVIDHGFIRSVYTFDPNGIALEFSVPGRIDPTVETRLCDRAPSAVAREGRKPVPSAWPAVDRPTPEAERRSHPGFGAELLDEECP